MSRIKYYDSTTQTWKYSDLAVQNPLPVGTNNGDILIWDATEQEWISAPVWRAYYQPIEYIQSTGTQYIDTGIKPSTNIKVKIKQALTDTSTPCVSGMLKVPDSAFAWGTLDGANFVSLLGATSQSWGDTGVAKDTNYHIWEIADGSQKLDGTQYATQSVVPYNRTIAIMANHSDSYSKIPLIVCYSQIYDGDTIVRDYIPVMNLVTNKAGLLDLAHIKFYGNDGTGDFIGGNPV